MLILILNLPVVEMHDSLEGAPSSCVDVSLKTRQERSDNIHTVFLALPVDFKDKKND